MMGMRSYRLFFTHSEDDIDRAIVYLQPFKPSSLEDTLVAGKGLGEGRTNSTAARLVVAAREGRDERVLVSEDERWER